MSTQRQPRGRRQDSSEPDGQTADRALADQQPGSETDLAPAPSLSQRPPGSSHPTSPLPDDRASCRTASSDLDLSIEIDLLRDVLSYLAGDIPARHKSIAPVVNTLVRAASFQAQQRAVSDER